MTKPKLLLIACGLFVLPGARAEDLASRFTWRMPLEGAFEAGTLYRLEVAGPVYDGSLRLPDDLRIIDEAGAQWPFYRWQPRDTRRFDERAIEVLNRSVVEGDDPYLRLEIRIEGERAPHNRVVIESAGSNFIRRVEVLGSDDRKTWGRLAEGYLIDHRAPSRVHNREIRYPDSDFPFLELRVHRNARDAGETVTVTSVNVGTYTGSEPEWQDVSLERVPPPGEEGEDGEDYQALYLDSGFARRPIGRLELEIAGGEFARPVRVLGRSGASNEWQRVYSGEIHRLGDASRLRLPVNTRFRRLKLEIYHYDDPPLQVEAVRAESVPEYLVFEPRSSGPAALYFGSARVEAPRYDLARRTDAEAVQAALPAETGPRGPNQAFEQDAADRYLPWITGAAIGLVSLIVLWVVAGMLKQGGGLRES